MMGITFARKPSVFRAIDSNKALEAQKAPTRASTCLHIVGSKGIAPQQRAEPQ
eukprot:m.352475 g.352475  ORF g.352475 m.352475 type:complete len:53 (+) comp55911_c0_seq27:1217-1375(+)